MIYEDLIQRAIDAARRTTAGNASIILELAMALEDLEAQAKVEQEKALDQFAALLKHDIENYRERVNG